MSANTPLENIEFLFPDWRIKNWYNYISCLYAIGHCEIVGPIRQILIKSKRATIASDYWTAHIIIV